MANTKVTRQVRRWAQVWKRAAPELERVRRAELAVFDYEASMEAIDSLLELALRFAVQRKSSGLVEQQRHFKRLRP